MASNDYTKELGMSTKQPKVPLPFVIILIVAIVAAGWYGFSKYQAPAHAHPADAGGKSASTPAVASPHGE